MHVSRHSMRQRLKFKRSNQTPPKLVPNSHRPFPLLPTCLHVIRSYNPTNQKVSL